MRPHEWRRIEYRDDVVPWHCMACNTYDTDQWDDECPQAAQPRELVSTSYVGDDLRPFDGFINGRARVHAEKVCDPAFPCTIHRPSNHKMRDWPMNLRETGLVERMCPHGVGHPDPDSAWWLERHLDHEQGTWGIHGCDGCCFA